MQELQTINTKNIMKGCTYPQHVIQVYTVSSNVSFNLFSP